MTVQNPGNSTKSNGTKSPTEPKKAPLPRSPIASKKMNAVQEEQVLLGSMQIITDHIQMMFRENTQLREQLDVALAKASILQQENFGKDAEIAQLKGEDYGSPKSQKKKSGSYDSDETTTVGGNTSNSNYSRTDSDYSPTWMGSSETSGTKERTASWEGKTLPAPPMKCPPPPPPVALRSDSGCSLPPPAAVGMPPGFTPPPGLPMERALSLQFPVAISNSARQWTQERTSKKSPDGRARKKTWSAPSSPLIMFSSGTEADWNKKTISLGISMAGTSTNYGGWHSAALNSHMCPELACEHNTPGFDAGFVRKSNRDCRTSASLHSANGSHAGHASHPNSPRQSHNSQSGEWKQVSKKAKSYHENGDMTYAEQEAAREVQYLCKKHNVDPRTIQWFLQEDNTKYLVNMATKCKELDRRSTKADSYVKNPSAWLTRYFNEVKNGTARY